jgi:hypothetical protein
MVVVGNSELGGLFADGNDKVPFGFGMAMERKTLTALSLLAASSWTTITE